MMRRNLAVASLAVAAFAALTPFAGPGGAAANQPPPDERTGDIIVRFQDSATLGDVAGALAASDTEAIKTTTLADIALVRPDDSVDAAIAALEADPSVLYAEPDYRVTIDAVPNDANYGSQWHYPKIGLPAAWDVTTGSATVIVAVVDTGVELTDPELDSKITTGANAGYDIANGDTDPTDDHGHGTHVAGTIAAETNNATGVAGVCWACKIMPVKVLDGTGNGSTLDVAAGIDWARTHGAKVVNLSLGSQQPSMTLQTAVTNAYNAGMVVVGAAGNNAGDQNPSDDSVLYPAAYANAIAVGATDSTDTIASFSNYGPELDVVAPGVSILSTVLGNDASFTLQERSWSGTSMATPHVAGAAGLLASAGITDPATIRTRLTSTATDLGAAGFDNSYGYGRINVHYALDTANPAVALTAPANGATVGGAAVAISANASDTLSGVKNVRFTIDAGSPIDDATAPYGTTWDTTGYANGSHTVAAQATDNAGNVSTHSMNVTVSNNDTTPPAVSINSPAAGATVSGSNILFRADASDDVGVTIVRFWADDTYLGYDTSPPYSRPWNTVPFSNGPHTLKAKAYDAANNGTEATISVNVSNPDTTAPSISITAPAAGATLNGSVSVDASASDLNGVSIVRFWVDGTYIGYDTAAPFSRLWNTTLFLNGTHVIKARAYDPANNSAETTISVTVINPDGTPPTVSIASPLDGATVNGSVTINADASDSQGLKIVRFWVDGTYIGYDTSAPYSRVWNTTQFSNGTHTIKAKAYDWADNGAEMTISVTVNN